MNEESIGIGFSSQGFGNDVVIDFSRDGARSQRDGIPEKHDGRPTTQLRLDANQPGINRQSRIEDDL